MQRRPVEIDNAVLDVRIQQAGNKNKSVSKTSKLPHLMARKQAKNPSSHQSGPRKANTSMNGASQMIHESSFGSGSHQNAAMMMNQE